MSGYWDLDPLLDLLVLLLAVLSPLWLPLFEWVLVDVILYIYICFKDIVNHGCHLTRYKKKT